MQNLHYHAFKKDKPLKGGKTAYRWYYYYIDPDTGKQVQRSCGTAVKSRKDAENLIRTLPPPPKAKNALGGTPTGPATNADLLVGDIARDMFVPGSDHVKRRQQLGKSVTPEALSNNRVFMRHIMGTWDERMLRTLELDKVMTYLFSVGRSASWKNQYTAALNEIYQEGQFLGCKVYKPNFPSIGKIPNKADILTLVEIEQLFKRENFRHDFFLFFLCAFSAGLRAGEARALRAKQIVFEKNAIIVDGFIKKKAACGQFTTNADRRNTPSCGSSPCPI